MSEFPPAADRTGLSRRSFLGSAAFLAAAGVSANSLLCRGAVAASASETILSGSHWGVFRGQVINGRFSSVAPWEGDPHPNVMLQGMRESVYSPTRIKYPMVRRAWLEQGPGADPAGRGTGDFVRVTWDKALDLVAGELERVRRAYGPQAIYGGSYGWKSVGKVHSCRVLLWRLLKLAGGFTSSLGNYSNEAASTVLPYVIGSAGVVNQCTTWSNLADNTQILVLWGCNPMNNSQIGWVVPDHGFMKGLTEVKRAGVKVICIDPVRTEACRYLNGEWIAPRPQTDVALMLGIAHTLYSEGLHDKAFIAKYTTGFDQFLPYLLGQADGTPKTVEWAAALSGIDAATIRELARSFARSRTMLAMGWSTQRQEHGEQPPWMLVTLAAMLGQIGLPGGGFGFSYHYSAGVPIHSSPNLPGMTDTPSSILHPLPPGCAPGNTTSYCLGGGASAIPVARVVDMLLNPGKTIQHNGSTITYPDIRLTYWVGGDPFAHHQNRNQMVSAWKRNETFIVHDFQWTPTARFADIVLPATTSYERNDIEQLGDFALSHIVPMKQLIAPMYEARNDYDIFADLAGRMGKRYEYTEGLEEMDWIRNFYEAAALESRAKGMEMPVFEVFWQHNEPLAFPVDKAQEDYVEYADFRADPVMNALGTPSGKIEIFSGVIAKLRYTDCPPHPTWMEPSERAGGPTTKYPLHVASNHPFYRLHSQLCGTELRTKYTVAGREPCLISPKDAAARGLRDGDVVRVFNDRGQILAGVRISDEICPGVIRICEGGWYDPVAPGQPNTLCRYGDVNVLTVSDATSKLAQGTCAQTAVAEVEKYTGPIPRVQVFDEPAAQTHAS